MVDAADPTATSTNRLDDACVHDSGDPLRGEVTRVVETVLAWLGRCDLPDDLHPVAHPHGHVGREDFDAPTTNDFLVLVPEPLHANVGPRPEFTMRRRRGHLSLYGDFARLDCREIGQGVGGGGVQQRYTHSTGGEKRPDNSHHPPLRRYQFPPEGRARRNDEAG